MRRAVWLSWVALAASLPGCQPDAAAPVSASQNLASAQAWVERGSFSVQDNGTALGMLLAASGDTAIVSGDAMYVFERDGFDWKSAGSLATPAPADTLKHLSLTADAAVLSIGSQEINAPESGDAIIVYAPKASGWTVQQTLTDLELGGPQLRQVAHNEQLLAVETTPQLVELEILAFERGASQLGPPQIVYSGPEMYEGKLVVSGEAILMSDPYAEAPNGSEGLVHVYAENLGVWNEIATLTSPDMNTVQFGYALATTETRLAVGTRGGRVYIFERMDSEFSEPVRIDPPDPVNEGTYNISVTDTALLAGLPEVSPPNMPFLGSAYLAFYSDAGWTDAAWLPRAEGMPNDGFGTGVALLEDAALVSAPWTNWPDTLGIVNVYAGCAVDLDCAAGMYCSASGTCALRKQQGEACDPERDCKTAGCRMCEGPFCSDGYCCDDACDDQCQACDVEGSRGECQAVEGTPHGARPACAGEDETCQGVCDGQSLSCVYAAVLTPCGSSCRDGIVTAYCCDGRGACEAGERSACGGYACADDGCLSECADDQDCAGGFSCFEEACVPVQPLICSEDGNASQGDEGITQCTPYRCSADTGRCASSCRSASDCAEGYVCDTRSDACVFTIVRPASDAGCDCRLWTGRARSAGSWAASLLALSLWVGRRFRTRRRT